MAQQISNLSLGSKVWISENDTPALYEIAGFNVHGSGTTTLVRVDIAFWTSWGLPTPYSQSAIDSVAQAFESRYSMRHRAALISVPLQCLLDFEAVTIETISRRVFVPSYTEMFGIPSPTPGALEGDHLSWYDSNAKRQKFIAPENDMEWWTRSWTTVDSEPTARTWSVNSSDGGGTPGAGIALSRTSNYGFVPAFVLSSAILVSDTPSGDGYEVYFPDALPQAIPIQPRDVYIDIGDSLDFVWEHHISTGTEQTKAELEYRIGNGAWQVLAAVIGNSDTAEIPAEFFPTGQVYWRIRTYNQDGVPGDWSTPTAFIGIGTPAIPTITGATNSNRPVISWNSTGQQGYELQIIQGADIVWQTGETAGVEKSRKLPVYLPNGEYTARLRIIGASLVWAAWAELGFGVDITPPATPAINAVAAQGAVLLTFEAEGVYTYLLRNDVPVADVTGLSEYHDYAALGGTRYAIRTVDEYDNYADSEDAYVNVTVAAPSLAAVDALDEPVILKHTRWEPRRMIDSFSAGVSYHYYAGREKPVARKSGFEAESHELSVAFKASAERDALFALVRRGLTLLYRDNWGNRWYCDVSALPGERDKLAATVTLTMVVVDYVEAIPYAEV